jgi:hypothetical protein
MRHIVFHSDKRGWPVMAAWQAMQLRYLRDLRVEFLSLPTLLGPIHLTIEVALHHFGLRIVAFFLLTHPRTGRVGPTCCARSPATWSPRQSNTRKPMSRRSPSRSARESRGGHGGKKSKVHALSAKRLPMGRPPTDTCEGHREVAGAPELNIRADQAADYVLRAERVYGRKPHASSSHRQDVRRQRRRYR